MIKPEDFITPKIKKITPYSYSVNGEIDLSQIEIRIDANESFSNLPDYIVKDIQEKIKTIDFNRYPDPSAADLTKKYAEYLKIAESADVNIKNIAVGNGSDELLNIIINSFLSKGDKILTFTPDFSMYAFYGDIIEADVIRVKKSGEDNFAIDFDEIADRVNKENIKLVIFSNPCNPTGQLESKEVLKRFIRSVNAVVVVDEVYMSFADCRGGVFPPEDKKISKENQSFLYDFLEYPNLIIMKSLSKAIGLAAIRVGFALSNEVFINMLKTVKSPFNVGAVSQKIAGTVLSYPGYLIEKLRNIKENKKFLQTAVENLIAEKSKKEEYKLYHTETNFILIESVKSKEIFDFLLANKILIRNIGNNFLRITTGSTDENKRLIECLNKYFI